MWSRNNNSSLQDRLWSAFSWETAAAPPSFKFGFIVLCIANLIYNLANIKLGGRVLKSSNGLFSW